MAILEKLQGILKLREAWPRIERNDEAINSELVGHKASGQAHSAAAITYSGDVAASNVQEAINKTDQRVSTIIAHNGDGTKDTELIDARGDAPLLRDRLDATDAQLADNDQKMARTQRMTFIRNADLTQLLMSNGLKVVITGDSVSYNRYGFDATARTNAYDCYPGMLSWSFMLRDAINRHDGYFKSWEELERIYNGTFASSILENNATRYGAAYNGIYTSARPSSPSNEIIIKYQTNPYSDRIVLHTIQQQGPSCTFDVYINNVLAGTVNNASDGTFQGIKPFQTEFVGGFTPGNIVEIKITNAIPNGSQAPTHAILIHGVGSIKRDIHLTGRGSWTSANLLADIQNRILQYSPDLLMVIAGANDIYQGVPQATYKYNMEQIITRSRAVNPKAEIVLITSPQSADYSAAVHKQYNAQLQELALAYDCYYVDLLQMFENTTVSKWRFDNIHLTRYGNGVLAKTILNMIMPAGLYDKNLVDSEMTFYDGKRYQNVTFINRGSCYATWDGTQFNLEYYFKSNPIIYSVTRQSGSRFRVRFNADIRLSNLTNTPWADQYGELITTPFIVKRATMSSGPPFSIDFELFKLDGTKVQTADWNTNNFKFMITYS